MREQDTGRLIETIYEAAVLPELWPDLLGEIAAINDFAGATLTAAPPIRSEFLPMIAPRIRWVASPSIHETIRLYFEEGWFARCGWAKRGLKLAHPGFVIDTDLFSAEEADAEPSYQFFRRHGIGGAATLFMRLPPSETFVFSFDRWLADGPVTPEMVARLEPLRPHLSRAALISSRLGLERAQAATQALAILGLPAAVLCPKHRIMAANDLMQGMMPTRVRDGAGGRFRLVDRGADHLLTRALGNALIAETTSRDPGQVFSIPVAAREEMGPLVVHVVPIRRRARDIFASAASIVIVTPVTSKELPAASVIQGLFDLTAAETRVARMIAGGKTVDDIAAHSHPSVVEFSADKLPGEVSTLNNRAVVEINGVRDRLRVLLISGEPHPGERTWRRLLKADPSVDLVHFTILRPPEKDDLTPLNELALIAFPVRELFLDKIDQFDLIILDRFQNRGLLPLPYIANIADRVRAGRRFVVERRDRNSRARPAWRRRRWGRCCRAGRRRIGAVVNEAFRPMCDRSGPAPADHREPARRQPAGRAGPAARCRRNGATGIAASSRPTCMARC